MRGVEEALALSIWEKPSEGL
ncbi:hypothetical protein ARTHRO9V_160227 [Arthrobacter sp. 9V]|nr:hypothetical protein ARTHRO9V_160227 [Arthrobacter sp. 9V]